MMDRNAATTTANDLLSSIMLARSEAIKRERVAVFSGNNDFSRWTVQVDTDDPPDKKADTTILHHDRPNNSVTVTASTNSITKITFNPRGRANPNTGLTAADYFKIAKGQATYFVCFSPNGRPKVQEDKNSNGNPDEC